MINVNVNNSIVRTGLANGWRKGNYTGRGNSVMGNYYNLPNVLSSKVVHKDIEYLLPANAVFNNGKIKKAFMNNIISGSSKAINWLINHGVIISPVSVNVLRA